MKKKFIIMGLLLSFAAIAVFAQAQRFNPGTYTATADGYNGPLTVSVVVDASRITAITITSHNDTPGFVNRVTTARNNMVGRMIAAQSAEVDVVTGATGTSNGLKAAVRTALAQATRN